MSEWVRHTITTIKIHIQNLISLIQDDHHVPDAGTGYTILLRDACACQTIRPLYIVGFLRSIKLQRQDVIFFCLYCLLI